MGNSFHYKCPNCDLRATCSKAVDRGFRIQVQPMFCSKCKTLKNIHIGNYEELNNKVLIHAVIKLCKTCNSGEFLNEWDSISCPSCKDTNMLIANSEICWD